MTRPARIAWFVAPLESVPMISTPFPERNNSSDEPTQPAVAPPATSTRRVLVVDDERHIVELVAALLEGEGLSVHRAYDGEEAWHVVARLRPDLVITDISMPRLSGIELLRRLRAVGELRRTPVILMSAVTRELEVEDASFLPKPFDIDRMLALVETKLATG